MINNGKIVCLRIKNAKKILFEIILMPFFIDHLNKLDLRNPEVVATRRTSETKF